MTKKKKHTLLRGEGTNQHTLYGDFQIDEETTTDFVDVLVEKDSLLKHEKPNGAFSGEHKTLQVETGEWRMGKQVEFNPFAQPGMVAVTRVWD